MSESLNVLSRHFDAIRPQYVLVVAVPPLCGCLLTLLAVLFAFSSPASHSLLVFRLSASTIPVALRVVCGYGLGLLESFAPEAILCMYFTLVFFPLGSPLIL
ncbi:hypothetical protein PISMIDRAFT_10171 [Pisolithus microcarpus 441]|uniref:Uncharacterized protein n=1 Tax=Pisolithus microcarpus 441 TaxID=765257 RepID=A0A0C9Z5Y9_9AGAM|nr:hypothetical protein BKA83DRAFT_10171 [Pisolithus microcarpus]KIK24536.1 hypothetical protein PISMIDRAFT_10171 [Pisolithus microcarpus 441]